MSDYFNIKKILNIKDDELQSPSVDEYKVPYDLAKQNPSEFIGNAFDTIDKFTGRPARNIASAILSGENPLPAAVSDKNTEGKEIARKFLNLLEKSGAPLRAPKMEEYPLEKPLGVVADYTLDLANLTSAGATGAVKGAASLAALSALTKGEKIKKIEKALNATENIPKNVLGMKSRLQEIIQEKIGKTATPEEILSWSTQAKPEEVEFVKLKDFLSGKNKVTKEEILSHIEKNQPVLKEYVNMLPTKEGLDDPTAFYKTWSLKNEIPGSYKETVITLPKNPGTFRESHFGDLKNVLSHARTQERINLEGDKLFHVDEIQSDWHQKGRKSGYLDPTIKQSLPEQTLELKTQIRNNPYGLRKFAQEDLDNGLKFIQKKHKEYIDNNLLKNNPELENELLKKLSDVESLYNQRITDSNNIIKQNPNVDFKKEFDDLSQKYDDILKDEKNVEKVVDAPFKKTWHELTLKKMLGNAVDSGASKMSWTPGKIQQERYENKIKEGGMEGFYDKIVPDFLRKLSKKYDAPMGFTKTDIGDNKIIEVPYIELSPKLKEAIKKGLPLFSTGAGIGLLNQLDNEKNKK